MTKTKWWVSTDLIGNPGSPKAAGPFSTREDAFAAREALEAMGANLSVFEEEITPAVDLPTEPTLGWVSVTDRDLLAVWSLTGQAIFAVDSDGGGSAGRDEITSFTPAVAVPKAALDELRKWREALRKSNGIDALPTPAVRRIDTFLAAVDAANGDPR
ncbi:MAG: hypothetical protein EOP24_39065 [Hyphomicrobiales bacterium]|nr:MAG: hypothetical protein EOP24_39065 [Hyphomicrobiales bacterium]